MSIFMDSPLISILLMFAKDMYAIIIPTIHRIAGIIVMEKSETIASPLELLSKLAIIMEDTIVADIEYFRIPKNSEINPSPAHANPLNIVHGILLIISLTIIVSEIRGNGLLNKNILKPKIIFVKMVAKNVKRNTTANLLAMIFFRGIG